MKMIKRAVYKLRGMRTEEYLKNKGCIIGKNFSMQPGVIIDPSHCFLIEIGDNVTLAPNVHILAHDASTKRKLNYTKIGRVYIGDNTFIGASSIILPNVKIGENCIVGAGSIVSKDIPNNSVVVGNPAKLICKTDKYIDKNIENLKCKPTYDESYKISNITEEKKQQMISELKDGIGYII